MVSIPPSGHPSFRLLQHRQYTRQQHSFPSRHRATPLSHPPLTTAEPLEPLFPSRHRATPLSDPTLPPCPSSYLLFPSRHRATPLSDLHFSTSNAEDI